MIVELEVDGKIVLTHEEAVDGMNVFMMHLKPYARRHYKHQEWNIYIRKASSMHTGNYRLDIDVEEVEYLHSIGKSYASIAKSYQCHVDTLYCARKKHLAENKTL